jgi:hypothetical protein
MNEENVGLMQRAEENDIRTMVSAVKNRLAAVRELMKSELKGPTKEHPEGRDYGVVPGTKKNVLLLPGAEKIALMFQFVPSFEITHTDLPGGHREYHAICTLTHSPTGRIVGQCSGSASTMESKHRYRGASGKTCSKCGAVSCKASKKEFGGGYYGDSKAGGCGERFKPGTAECLALDEIPTMKQENLDPADQFNTVNKISQKRAYVGAVKGASAASEVFTADLEDGPPLENSEKDAPKPEIKPPQSKSGAVRQEAPPPVAEEEKHYGNQPAEIPGDEEPRITEPQSKRFYAIWAGSKRSTEEMKAYIFSRIGSPHTKDIPKRMYDEMCVYAGKKPE